MRFVERSGVPLKLFCGFNVGFYFTGLTGHDVKEWPSNGWSVDALVDQPVELAEDVLGKNEIGDVVGRLFERHAILRGCLFLAEEIE